MESTIVIKVKFGKTLRRFNARVSEARNLELSLNGLLEKARSLFNLSPEADITLTYLDEDGDSVTLADDEDLKDAMSQSLNPLRITVKLNSDQGNISSSPRVTQPLPDLSRTVSKIFKAVPEPLGKTLSKLSHDLESKATASSPQLPELIQQFSKMLQSSVVPASDSQAGNVATQSAKESEAVPNSANPAFRHEKRVHSSKYLPPWIKEHGESSLKAETTKPACGNIKADIDVLKQRWGLNPHGVGECPFSGTPVENEPPVPNTHFSPRMHPFKRSFSHGGVAGVLHRGVQCDGCGVHPISGPRFKSKVKEDYDLCSICFAEMGSEADYTRMDHPVHRRPHLFKRPHKLYAGPIPPPGVIPPFMQPLFRTVGKQIRPKLDSRFIMDVNVIDGTMMAPSTPFTKIWRMRNNGTLVWPLGTRVVWIGGDRLSASLSAGLQIPGEGLAVENELEIAVDFRAPELPGRYISYWRMTSPSGQKFGQRIWVLIQVDASAKDPEHKDNFRGLNLNLPHESSVLNGPESESNNVVPVAIGAPIPISEPFKSATDLKKPLDAPFPIKVQHLGSDLYEPESESNNVIPVAIGAPIPISESSKSATELEKPLDALFPIQVQHLGSDLYEPESESKDQDLDSGLNKAATESNYDVPVIVDGCTPVNDLVEPLDVALPIKNQALDFPTNDNLLVNGATVDSYVVPPPMTPALAESSTQASGGDVVEQTLLMELEAMGFKEVDLNKEILRKNEYDLEQSVDDLCGVSDWDPILEELQEMGFCDDEMNKKLLKKNNGSIKGAVMDLISAEKP